MTDDDDLLLITNGGTMVRTPCQYISVLGRNTQGVTLIGLTAGEQLVRVDAVSEPSDSALEENAIVVVPQDSDLEINDESVD